MKPRVGIYGLTSCAGDQLALLNCEDELLDVVAAVDLRAFAMAQSGPEETELDVAFVEGAVTQRRDLEALKDIRRRARLLVALGTCATWGGIPAALADDAPAVSRMVSGETAPAGKPGFFEHLPATPLSAHVQVDLAVPGCPVEKEQLLSGLASLLHGDLPRPAKFPVCAECKAKDLACVLVRDGAPCAGPLTVAGCGARCPGLNRPCAGCRGPVEEANFASAYRLLLAQGHDPEQMRQRLRAFASRAVGL
ncbi:MAG: hypothetical protein ACM3RP_01640 [Chitinophagales bacterium]